MGLLDNNKVITTPFTGLEGSSFKKFASTDIADVYVNERTDSSSKVLKLTYRDLYAWSDTTKVYLVKGKITDTPVEVSINDTNFPHLRKDSSNNYPAIAHIIACPFTNGIYGSISGFNPMLARICVIFNNGQIYHNYPSCYDNKDFYSATYAKDNVPIETIFDKFDESVIWDLPNRKHPVKTTTGADAELIATGVYYYNPALPDNCYEMHPALNQSNGYGNTVGFGATTNINNASSGTNIGTRARFWRIDMDNPDCNSFTYMGGLVMEDIFTMIATYRTNSGSNPCRMCVFGSQDGGRSWFVMYEFAGMDRTKKGTDYSNASVKGVALSQEGNVGSGVYSIKRRTIIVPTADAKEPDTWFEYGEPIAVSSIVGTSDGITVTTASNHGFVNGDVVVMEFQSGASATGRAFDWMVNGSTNGTSGGNGILFRVWNVSSDSFSLTFSPYNPDSGLPIRHIHSLNRCKDGVTVSCGESYPFGWVLFDSIKRADNYDGYNIASLTQNTFTRLTSTADSMQRPLGVIVKQEGKDTNCYFAADHAFIPLDNMTLPQGRTAEVSHNSVGVWKIPLSGVDDFKDNAEMLLNSPQPSFGFQEVLGHLIFIGQNGDLCVSSDNGKTWEKFFIPAYSGKPHLSNWAQFGCHFSGPTYDRMVSLNNILIQLKK